MNRFYAILSISVTALFGYISSSYQEHLEIISKNISELVSFVDQNQCFQYVNESYLDWFGISREKIVNQPLEKVLGQQIYEKIKPFILSALKGEEQDFEIQILKGNGKEAFVQAKYFPKKNWAGKTEGFFAIISDLTPFKQNELLIERENKRLETILNSIPFQIWVLNENGEIKYFNTACQDIVLQLDQSFVGTDFIGKNIIDIYSDLWRQEDIETLKGHLKEQTKFFSFEYSLYFPTGQRHFLILGTNMALEGFDGKFVISHIDITQRKLIEEKIANTKSQLEAILDNSPAIIYMKDMSGRYLMVNQFYEEALNINREDIIGKTTHEVFPKVLADQFVKNDHRVMTTLQPQEVEEEIWDHAAGKKTVLSIQFPLKHENGNPYGICGISTDITQRKRDFHHLQKLKTGLEGEIRESTLELIRKNEALTREIEGHQITQRQLETSEERFKYALEVSSDGIWDWNLKTDEVYFSPGWKESLGYKPDEVANNLDFWKNIVHPDDLEKVTQALQKHLNEETDFYICENRLCTKSGQWRWNLVQGKVVEWDDEGKPSRMIGTDTNINHRKEAELALQETQKQLNHMEKLSALGKLTGSISHEFNNPIYAIRLILEQLTEEVNISNENRKGLMIAINECKRISNLIAKLKDFYLPTSGELKSVFLNELIDDVLMLLRGPFEKKGIQVIKNFQEDEKPVYVVEDQIKQVLLNILQNAFEAFEPDSKKMDIGINTSFSETEAKVIIRDSGSGISKDIFETIFEPFVTTKGTEKGSGLGLPVSYSIIEDHSGKIDVESELSKGSCFTITLPVEDKI
ncbi:MAG: PAS domain S-box protein [Nitrospinota bacterium]